MAEQYEKLYDKNLFEGKLGWITKEKTDEGKIILTLAEHVLRLVDSEPMRAKIVDYSRAKRVAPRNYKQFSKDELTNYAEGNYNSKEYENLVQRVDHLETESLIEKNRENVATSGKGKDDKYELSFSRGKNHCSHEFTAFNPIPENEKIINDGLDKNVKEIFRSITEYHKKEDLNLAISTQGKGSKDVASLINENIAKLLDGLVKYERQTKQREQKTEKLFYLIEPDCNKDECTIDEDIKTKIYMPWAKDLCKRPIDLEENRLNPKIDELLKLWKSGDSDFFNRLFGQTPFLDEQRLRFMEYLQEMLIKLVISSKADVDYASYHKLFNWPGAPLIYSMSGFNGKIQQGHYSPKLYSLEVRQDWSWATGQDVKEDEVRRALSGELQKEWLRSVNQRHYVGTRIITIEGDDFKEVEKIADTYSITGPFSKKLYSK